LSIALSPACEADHAIEQAGTEAGTKKAVQQGLHRQGGRAERRDIGEETGHRQCRLHAANMAPEIL
jgi:hypothetical protein